MRPCPLLTQSGLRLPGQTTALGRTSEIGNLQQPAVADPRSGQVGLGLVSCSGVAARLIQFRKSEVRPGIGRRSGERTLELLLRLIEAATLQQSSGKRLPDRVIAIRRLSIG